MYTDEESATSRWNRSAKSGKETKGEEEAGGEA